MGGGGAGRKLQRPHPGHAGAAAGPERVRRRLLNSERERGNWDVKENSMESHHRLGINFGRSQSDERRKERLAEFNQHQSRAASRASRPSSVRRCCSCRCSQRERAGPPLRAPLQTTWKDANHSDGTPLLSARREGNTLVSQAALMEKRE